MEYIVLFPQINSAIALHGSLKYTDLCSRNIMYAEALFTVDESWVSFITGRETRLFREKYFNSIAADIPAHRIAVSRTVPIKCGLNKS